MRSNKLEDNQIENENEEEEQTAAKPELTESQKFYILATICLMVFLDFTGYGLPITLYPAIALERGWSASWVGVVFGLFPFGGFFTSCLAGKIMRFYKKDKLLLIFLIITCVSKFLFGCVYFIEDSNTFLIVSIVARLILGFSFTAFQTVSISLIPETWPDQIVQKLSYYELFLNCGLISGPLLGSALNYFLNFFWVFAILSALHLVLGLFGIFYFLKIDQVKTFMQTKESLDMTKIVTNSTLMIQFFFQSLFLGSVMFISSGFENHIIYNLGSTQSMSAMIYTLLMIGFCISLLIVNKVYKSGDSRRGYFLLGSIMIIVFNNLFGPDPWLGITDQTAELVCVAIAFFMVGVSQGIIAVLLVPEYKDILRVIFPDEPEELLVDMSPALYLSAYSLAEFANSIIGGIIIDDLGFVWTSVVYSAVLIVYFVIYWGNQWRVMKSYKPMVEERELTENNS